MYEGIRYAESAVKSIKKSEKETNEIDKTVLLTRGFQDFGYAQGIEQALVCMGFKHEEMKKLSKLTW